MKIHEYQAKSLMASYNIPVSKGVVAHNALEAWEAAKLLGGKCIVKAQVHSGGRGKAGGVKFAQNSAEAEEVAEEMLGMNLITNQTGPEGKIVRKVLIEEPANIKNEYYLSITLDNESAGLVIIASAAGGTEIEEISETRPELIIKEPISPSTGYKSYHGRNIVKGMGIPKEMANEFIAMLGNLNRLFMEKDCSLVEINPLVITEEGKFLALDAKINFDDNALFRHKDILAMRDLEEENPKEVKASRYDLNYISLDGSIGCMVNGAGLAMATMDIIQKFGGTPANFLDVGGSATKEKVAGAFEILLSDKNVKAIMVNIFGGIMKCDVIAEGIVEAAKKIDIKVPLVVRLEGTNLELGKEILKKSGLAIISAEDMAEAAKICADKVRELDGGGNE
ncbi:MAG: ADP-forming succinate--CoA ligase subunit beta [Lachnospiraceae bacterium]